MPRPKTLSGNQTETLPTPATAPQEMEIDLPAIERAAAPTVYIQNRRNEWYVLDPGDAAVPVLVLGPLAQMGLPHEEFWLKSPKLRDYTDAPADDPTRDMPLRVFARKSPYGAVKAIPLDKQCEEKFMNNVLQICYGPLELPNDLGGAIDEIMLDPRVGNPPRTDVRFLVHVWRLVLESAQWVLTERRRTGHEVDSRRLDLIKTRLTTIEEMRLDFGLSRKQM